ncbi:putative RNA-binding protein EIF1AD [Camelus dromedarius]|uniref:Probable RNA-binding protein EIF1AD n=1 Tax=Camelus dromedarius TaxID=9838 RepID=A0A5N4BY81_CAMDR|nr:putative RNA-binding protein EIF1AD [Camelus dromedarius]
MVPSDQQEIVRHALKYRKNIWIKRGDFLIVDPIEEGEKVKAEISFVLCKDHVRLSAEGRALAEAFSKWLRNTATTGTSTARTLKFTSSLGVFDPLRPCVLLLP